jgi:prevent-host-death family protein
MQVNIHQAKTTLSELLRRVDMGEEIIIARSGKPVARIVPHAAPGQRSPGGDEDQITIAADFDAPLPELDA